MGLTNASVGIGAVDCGLEIHKQNETDVVVALAGNPNVGKSTVFNALTGMRQHTGNWPGKTVASAQGYCKHGGRGFVMVDIPGCYSLLAHSAEEVVASDFLCSGQADAVVVVCDATCLERNMNLVLQTIEITPNVTVCINLMDEARRKGIYIDTKLLATRLGVPVTGASARTGRGLSEMMDAVSRVAGGNQKPKAVIDYGEPLEHAIKSLLGVVDGGYGARRRALRLLEGRDEPGSDAARDAVAAARTELADRGISGQAVSDAVVEAILRSAEQICSGVVKTKQKSDARDRRIDKILTSRVFGFPIMLAMLAVIFWITISGANYPSQLLSSGFGYIEDKLLYFLDSVNAPEWLSGALVLGVYRVLSWVIAVMLPPMAIFFPLFTLMEDFGYLPRVAFNLDKCFKKCNACGKQALTMCMGFGCNAAGVVGCRIIDSPRERLIAMLTNSFVPCNGRFPTMISIISMFFIGAVAPPWNNALSAAILALIISLGILMTFISSKLLSSTVLKGKPSSFTLELPPYRRPKIGSVIVRSIVDRTLFVLGRAAAVAAPAGLIIWLTANISIGGSSILSICSDFLDPFARLLGLDGVILMAFILGIPANEIVLPIILMAYTCQGTIAESGSIAALHSLLADNGWTWVTAVCTIIFSLMHWPCSTTLLTIKKESGGIKWMILAAVLPTAVGMLLCLAVSCFARLSGLG